MIKQIKQIRTINHKTHKDSPHLQLARSDWQDLQGGGPPSKTPRTTSQQDKELWTEVRPKYHSLIQQAIKHASDHPVELKIIYSIKILQNPEPSKESEQFAVQQLLEFLNTPLQQILDI